jgi:multiple sugar transport system substrate-binding protein
LFDFGQLAGWAAASVGRTWSSYGYLDRQWALPIDAATQVAVRSADLADALPRRWDQLPAFAAAHPTTLCLGGPHAGLSLLAMASSAGAIDALIEPAFGVQALQLLRSLWPLVDQAVSLQDPIAVHQAVAGSGGPVYCPLAYGYASYAADVAWSDAPGWLSGPPGSVLGGTGLAVSALTGSDLGQVRRYVRAYLDPAVQNVLVPAAGGQPATTAAWTSAGVDRAAGGYYSSTLASIRSAWVRPRTAGWIELQERISVVVRDSITGSGDPAAAITEINARYSTWEDRS